MPNNLDLDKNIKKNMRVSKNDEKNDETVVIFGDHISASPKQLRKNRKKLG